MTFVNVHISITLCNDDAGRVGLGGGTRDVVVEAARHEVQVQVARHRVLLLTLLQKLKEMCDIWSLILTFLSCVTRRPRPHFGFFYVTTTKMGNDPRNQDISLSVQGNLKMVKFPVRLFSLP